MAPVADALNHILEHHEPLPAVVLDRFWNVRRQNKAAELMFSIGGDPTEMLSRTGGEHDFNLALLTLHPQGLRPFIVNWEQAAPAFIRRLTSEALASGDPQVHERFAGYIELAGRAATAICRRAVSCQCCRCS